jgi:tetratricopeptide (TPR) repeat protein
MPSENRLWALSPPETRGEDSWLPKAAALCQSQQCEACITALRVAAQAEPENYAIQYQLGICYSGGCRIHSQTSPEIALIHLQRALTHASSGEQPKVRASILGAMGNTYLAVPQVPRRARLQLAIECYEEASTFYHRLGDLECWAREEFNLGNACCDLPDEASSDKWEQAVLHYEKALQVRTRERDPLRHAATLENLGTAYRELPTGDRAANVRRAIQCFRKALHVYTASGFPEQNAALHNNLGNAYVSMPSAAPASTQRNMRRALRHFDRALKVRTRAQHPCDYAVTQFNRGSALLRFAVEAPDAETHVRDARNCFEEAEECFSLCGKTELAQQARERAKLARSCLRAA